MVFPFTSSSMIFTIFDASAGFKVLLLFLLAVPFGQVKQC